MPLSADFLHAKQEHRHSFLVMQALKSDQLVTINEEIKDFEQVNGTGPDFFFARYW